MKNVFKSTWVAAAAAFALLIAADSAFAIPTILVDFDDDGIVEDTFTGNVITGNVSTSFVSNPGSGIVELQASGSTKPSTGSAVYPELASTTLAVSGSGKVAIYFFDIGFGPSDDNFLAEVSYTKLGTNGTITYSTYASAANMPFTAFSGTDTANAITVQTLNGGLGSSSALGAVSFPTVGPYALLQKVIIEQEGGTTGLSANLASVPDGGSTVALLGCSLLGLAYVRNRSALLKA